MDHLKYVLVINGVVVEGPFVHALVTRIFALVKNHWLLNEKWYNGANYIHTVKIKFASCIVIYVKCTHISLQDSRFESVGFVFDMCKSDITFKFDWRLGNTAAVQLVKCWCNWDKFKLWLTNVSKLLVFARYNSMTSYHIENWGRNVVSDVLHAEAKNHLMSV